MPLLKLWNSLRGRTTQAHQTDSPQADTSARSIDAAGETANAETNSNGRSKPAAKAKSGGFGLFGGGQYAGLRKLVKPLAVESVLEIGVGDGSRALHVLQTLESAGHEASYIGIDEFEMAGSVSLKEIHRTLRSGGVRPQLFPGPAELGIMRVAHTIGTVDLILISAGPNDAQNQAAFGLMCRVCHQNTVVLMEQDETWSRVSTPQRTEIRRAA